MVQGGSPWCAVRPALARGLQAPPLSLCSLSGMAAAPGLHGCALVTHEFLNLSASESRSPSMGWRIYFANLLVLTNRQGSRSLHNTSYRRREVTNSTRRADALSLFASWFSLLRAVFCRPCYAWS